MITVLIYSVMTEHEYEFRLDSSTPIGELIEEIGEMVCQREQCQMVGDSSDLLLFSREKSVILERDNYLSNYGICTGERLILC